MVPRPCASAYLIASFLALASAGSVAALVDTNGNQMSDVWEKLRGGAGLSAATDTDKDGFTNLTEAIAGTNPSDPLSNPRLALEVAGATSASVRFPSELGKRYTVEQNSGLAAPDWTPLITRSGSGDEMLESIGNLTGSTGFFRLRIEDTDTDADGANDWEELALGFDPTTARTARMNSTDLSRITAGLKATSTVTVAPIDPLMREDWPDRGVFAIRRANGLLPITVSFLLGGTAGSGSDYVASAANSISIPAGVREAWIEITPLPDNEAEPDETITVTLVAGPGYALGTATNATATLSDAAPQPGVKAAARFLLQAAFGPNADSPADPDEIPENVEEVIALGFEGWIEDQFLRPVGLLQPWTDWAATNAQAAGIYGNAKQHAWWNRVMGVPKLRPDDPPGAEVTPDPLRQRVAFALSQILVVSDRPEQLAVEQRGMANYYDLMVAHAFGNYRDLLRAVALHPAMGIYLSHLGNQKANPALKRYPDENFAREIMQLFSIGLWQLNPDGTHRLSDGTDLDPEGNVIPEGEPIPTYGNGDITELARVFTGLSFGNNANFALNPRDFTQPMKMWDAEHDCEPKLLLGTLNLPARTPSAGNLGTAGLADVDAAIDQLFNHPNVGPFIGRQLIQRLVTSNPSAQYIGNVSAAFADNGSGVRGDLKAVVRAILLDPEARDPAKRDDPTFGKLREPLLRVANLAHAFNASSPSGWYPLDQFAIPFAQDPMNAPSVFNFFLPNHSPPGALTQLGLVAPEFQIVNASTAVTGANYFWGHILGDLQYWGAGNATYSVQLDLATELPFITPADQIAQNVPAGPALDPDPLLRRLDLVLTGGSLSPAQFQILRETVLRINPPTWLWHRERFRLAVYLIVSSPEFSVLR